MRRVVVYAASDVLRAGLAAVTASNGSTEIAGAAATPEELDRLVTELEPDVVLAEFTDPDDQAFRQVLSAAPAFVALAEESVWPLILLSDELKGRAVLGRDASPREIGAAIEGAAEGLLVLPPAGAIPLIASRTLRQPDVGPETLTQREIEVLGILAEGLGNKTIARRLGISDHTVKFHVRSVLAKLGASSRTEAVTAGVRRGLITI